MMITYKIYGMHSRDDMIENLKHKLDLSDNDIYYDDRPNGGLALYTAKKAWLSPLKEGETHRVVFPDDVEVCNGFKEICDQIVETHPNCIVSLFSYRYSTYNKYIETIDTPYLYADGLSGIGIIMPVKYIEECFSYIKNKFDDNIDDDLGMLDFAINKNIPIITTIPSLVQHLGDNSLLDPNKPIRRTVYYNENPVADWTIKKIVRLPAPAWFAPKNKEV